MQKKTLFTLILSLICLTSFGQISTTANSLLTTSGIESHPRSAKVAMVNDSTSITYIPTVENNVTHHTFYLMQEGAMTLQEVKLDNTFGVVTDIEVFNNNLYFCGSIHETDFSQKGFVVKADISNFFNYGAYSLRKIQDAESIQKIEVYLDGNNNESIAALSIDKLFKVENGFYYYRNLLPEPNLVESWSDIIIYRDYIVTTGGYHVAGDSSNHGYFVEIFDKTQLSAALPFNNKIQIQASTQFQYEWNVLLTKLEEDNSLYLVAMPYMSGTGYYSMKGIDINAISFTNLPSTITNYTIIPNNVNVSLFYDTKALKPARKQSELCILANYGAEESFVFCCDLANINTPVHVYKYPEKSLFTALDVYANSYFHTIGGIWVEDLNHSDYTTWTNYSTWDENILATRDRCVEHFSESINRNHANIRRYNISLDNDGHQVTNIPSIGHCSTKSLKKLCQTNL